MPVKTSVDYLKEALDYRNNYEQKVREAAQHVKRFLGDKKPAFGITLGSGLGEIATITKQEIIIPYSEIPYFPTMTVPSHEGKLIIGSIEGVPVIVLKGRKHYYEVADEPFSNGMLKVVFPVHVLAELGVKRWFTTNATGALNPAYKVGDLMIVKSHISFLPNPLLGRQHDFKRVNDAKPVLRFQPMHEAYDSSLRKLLLKAAEPYKDFVHEGMLLAVTGPTYETHAESLFFRKGLGVDAVGMSVPPEIVVAANRGMRAVAFSCITDVIHKDGSNPTSHEEVMSVLNSQEVKKRFEGIVRGFFRLYRETSQ